MSSSRQLAENCTVLIKNLKVGDSDKVKHFVCRKTKNMSGEIALSVAKISPAFPGHLVRKSRACAVLRCCAACMLANIVHRWQRRECSLIRDSCVCTRVHVCVRVCVCVCVCARARACVRACRGVPYVHRLQKC
jgi:hypothetical protein